MYDNLFIAPPEIRLFSLSDPKTWTKKQANIYTTWLENEKLNRIDFFCRYFDIETRNQFILNDDFLNNLQTLIYDEVVRNNDKGYFTLESRDVLVINNIVNEIVLSSSGYALGGDLGLFMYDSTFKLLNINKKLEADVNFGKKYSTNLPVYFYTDRLMKDPVLSGINYLKEIINCESGALIKFKKEIVNSFGPNRIDPRAILKDLG